MPCRLCTIPNWTENSNGIFNIYILKFRMLIAIQFKIMFTSQVMLGIHIHDCKLIICAANYFGSLGEGTAYNKNYRLNDLLNFKVCINIPIVPCDSKPLKSWKRIFLPLDRKKNGEKLADTRVKRYIFNISGEKRYDFELQGFMVILL